MKGSRTKAQEVYAAAYSAEGAGMPDRKIIAGLPEAGLKILSLGSGSGSDLWFLAGQNEIHAFDSSPSAIEAACAHGLRGEISDLEQPLPFADATFDIVVAKDLIEHLLTPERLLKEVRRVLKPQGRLVLSVPNHFYLPFRLRLLFGGNLIWRSLLHNHSLHFEEWNYMHIRFFTWRGLQRFLSEEGLEVQRAFWDFGILAHYANLDMFQEHIIDKYAGRSLTPKAKFFLYGVMPAWRLFNLLFPPQLRHFIVGLAPGLLCAGFYLHCSKRAKS